MTGMHANILCWTQILDLGSLSHQKYTQINDVAGLIKRHQSLHII